jgi:hypothetical protein
MGERSAVGSKSGESVRQSDPGLRRPTTPATVGRKPAARPSSLSAVTTEFEEGSRPREAGPFQPKTGRGAGRSPALYAQREALGSFTGSEFHHLAAPLAIEDSHVTALIQFFQTLDLWDREYRASARCAQAGALTHRS